MKAMLEIGSVYLLRIGAAVVVLILGWFAARILSGLVKQALKKTALGEKMSRWIMGEDAERKIDVDQWISNAIFYILLVFVIIAFFQVLGLTLITEPLNKSLTLLFEFIPNLIGAALLLIVAWAVASILKFIVVRAGSVSKIDERFSSRAELKEAKIVPLSKTLGEFVYWLVLLLFLPAILTALNLRGLLQPVQSMVEKILSYLPNIFSAILLLLLGWFLAHIVRKIISNLLESIGTNQLSEKVGLSKALGEQKASHVVGLVVYILILIPFVIAALNTLQLEAITQPATEMLYKILAALPPIFAATLVVVISYVLGRLAATLITNLLMNVGVNTILERIGLYKPKEKDERLPSEVVGYTVLVVILLFASIEALRLLNFESVAMLLTNFTIFLGHVILGLIILAVGLFFANVATKLIMSSNIAQASFLSLCARVAIVILAVSMALRQMGLANEIINIAFGLLFGAVTVAIAISFGLGGREIAARKLEDWLESKKKE